MNKIIFGMLLVLQALSLQVSHFNTGSSSMRAADGSSLLWFIIIGVVAFIVITVIICCLFRQNPEYRDSYVQEGQQYNHNTGYYEANPNLKYNNYNPNPYNNPGYYH